MPLSVYQFYRRKSPFGTYSFTSRKNTTLSTTGKIQQLVHKLPTVYQEEVLDFVEYLLAKAVRRDHEQEAGLWSDFSLGSAMRGMEFQNTPQYTAADLIERFSESDN